MVAKNVPQNMIMLRRGKEVVGLLNMSKTDAER
jgi:hypothetical protein